MLPQCSVVQTKNLPKMRLSFSIQKIILLLGKNRNFISLIQKWFCIQYIKKVQKSTVLVLNVNMTKFQLNVVDFGIICKDECFVYGLSFLNRGFFSVNDISNSSESNSFSDNDKDPPVRSIWISSSRTKFDGSEMQPSNSSSDDDDDTCSIRTSGTLQTI